MDVSPVSNHENASAAQAIAVGIGAVVHLIAPQHDTLAVAIFGAIFALLGVLKPFLPPKVQAGL